MEFKKRIFLLPSFGNFEQICKYLFPLVCLYFIFISFFLFLSTNNLQENISIREEFYIYLFFPFSRRKIIRSKEYSQN